jgi:3-deoxy-7-phosphoheptulonate synthase
MMAAGIPLPTPETLMASVCLSPRIADRVATLRQNVARALNGEGWILVVGPCGLHHVGGALEYADRLAALQETLPSDWIILMRGCFEKSRSSLGWKGLLHGGEGRTTLQAGLEQTRIVLRGILERGIGTAAEILSPFALPYLDDLLAYGWIGARTSSSQTHREIASSAPFAVGFKNGLDGDFHGALKGALVSSQPHLQMALGGDGTVLERLTPGNPCPHVIFRGSVNGPNVSDANIQEVASFMNEHGLCSRVMVDCSHGNSGKRPEMQRPIVQKALHHRNSVAGVFIESYLKGGMRPDLGPFSDPHYSITDPCLSWEQTRILLLEAADYYAGASIQRNHSW